MGCVDLICSTCSKPIQKTQGEYNRRVKAGATRFFCNQSCTAVANNKSPNRIHIPPTPGSNRNEDTPFRWFLARARHRKHLGPHDLTPAYLRNLWEEGGGRCPLTGWDMILPHSAVGWRKDDPKPRRASLDRIDCSRGYVQGNVRFVSVMANWARHDFSDEELIEFCRSVITHMNTKRDI